MFKQHINIGTTDIVPTMSVFLVLLIRTENAAEHTIPNIKKAREVPLPTSAPPSFSPSNPVQRSHREEGD
jgi:hypothetical protein